MKVLVRTAAAAPGTITAVDAQARTVPKRCDRLRKSVSALSPPTWNGSGPPPIGWLFLYGVLNEPSGARVAIVATDGFAQSTGLFSGALDALPSDWI